jgi:AmiR/NasT family two-component response regulator
MKEAKRAGPRKVLLVDDDRLVLSTLSSGLEQAGYAVQAAGSVEEALRVLAIESPDLAVLDVRMPGQSGLELAGQLREAGEVPFIFLTAYSDADIVQKAAAYGALGYVVKPADIPQLVPAMEAALARAEEMRRLRETERQLQTALSEGREVSMAIGLIMERRRLDRQQAFELLRSSARTQRRKIGEVAQEILSAAELLNVGKAQ